VTHNPAMAANCDRILRLQAGLLRPDGVQAASS